MLIPATHAKRDLETYQSALNFPPGLERDFVRDFGERHAPVSRRCLAFGLGFYILGTMACSTLLPAQQPSQVVSATAPLISTPTAAPTRPVGPLFEQVTLTSVDSEESGQPLDFTVISRTPQLVGSDDPRLVAFNQEMTGVVRQAVTEFKANLVAMPPTAVNAPSSFDVHYHLLSPPGALLSIKLEFAGYISGAAHPYGLSRAVNFDLNQGRDLGLAELFRPGSDYLGRISSYCMTQLASRDIAFDAANEGAAPTLENYRNWNITADGLLVTFDEYQVAAYAAGPQVVLIPYAVLRPLIENPGPLDPYILRGP
jgi:hypothetical protein